MRFSAWTGNYTFTIKNVTLKNGKHSTGGGAFRISNGTVNATNIIFDTNATDGSGGAVYMVAGTATIDRSLFKSNTAATYGGAIYMQNGTLTLTNSTLVDNTSGNHGGAINVSSGTATLAHLTVWNNKNTNSGGDWVTAIVAGGTTDMYNSIIGRASSHASHKLCGGGFNNSTAARGVLIHNPASSDGCPLATEADPLLGGLTGSPGYLPLGAGSAAIGGGRPATCTEYPSDQRGAPRSLDNCDIGAVQYFMGEAMPEEGGGGGVYSPSATSTPIACTGELLNKQGYRIQTTYGLCAGVQFQRVYSSGIGIGWIVAGGFVDAIDVWAWVQPTVEVCFPQAGKTLFLNAAFSPRSVEPLASFRDGNFTCARIGSAGTVVLMAPNSAHGTAPADSSPGPLIMPAPAPAAPAPEPTAIPSTPLANCMVRTKAILNLRSSPGGGDCWTRALGSLADRFRVFERLVLHRFSRRARLDQR